jgi:ABC-type glycerol-3-phosphate transport system substrate-binding protein
MSRLQSYGLPLIFMLLATVILGIALMAYSVLDSSQEVLQVATGRNLIERTKPTLRIWVTYNDEQFRVYRKVARRFEVRENVNLKISKIPWSGQSEFFQYACNSHRAPDIARMDLGLIPKFAAGGALLTLDSHGLSDLFPNLLPAALDACQVRTKGGEFKTYALPDEFTTLALFYNRDHFKRAGLDPSIAPRNWDEFKRYAKSLTQDKDQDGSADQFGFAMNISPWFSMPFLYSFGGKILDDQRLECLLDQPQAIDALKFQISLAQEGMEAGAWRQGAIKPDSGFKSGRYSMIFSGPWNLENFRRSGVNFSVALIPGNPQLKIHSSTNVGGNANVIFRSSKFPKLAVRFLKYLLSKEVQDIFVRELGSIPLRTDLKPSQEKLVNEELAVFMEQALYAGSRPKIPGYDRIEDIVNKEVETAFEGHRTPKGAYSQACRKINKSILNQLR